ncbi:MAG: response regulator transcription factor [Anaerolineales bacterium]|nr:response regulator transcription factor [Anaerolineales bacterium]MCB8962365.1 response regulator transcription factor [Ardenticatenales bacterium]
MNEPIRVLIVDDQKLMRAGLRTLLELENDIEVVGEAENGVAGLSQFEAIRPDVVLMDIRMPQMDGVEATGKLMAQHPAARILILTTFDDDEYVFRALEAGALGYMLKDVSGDELATAVRTIAAGNALLGQSVARKVLAQALRPQPPSNGGDDLNELSEREIEILRLISDGRSNPEIARELFLAEGTVKNYVSRILQKSGARDRTQAAIWAQQQGLI